MGAGAGDGKTSGNGSTSPFGSPAGSAGAGAASGGHDFVRDPMGAFDTSGGNDSVRTPTGTADGRGANRVAMGSVPQPMGSFRNPNSVPQGGTTPAVRGGTDPSPARTQQFFAAGGPSAPKKPYKFK